MGNCAGAATEKGDFTVPLRKGKAGEGEYDPSVIDQIKSQGGEAQVVKIQAMIRGHSVRN